MPNDIVLIDEDCLLDCANAALAPEYIRELNNILLRLQANENDVFMVSHYTNIEFGYGGLFLYDILFSETCPVDLPIETIRQLNVLLDRCVTPECDTGLNVTAYADGRPLQTRSAVYSGAFDLTMNNRAFPGVLRRVKGGISAPARIMHGERSAECYIFSEKTNLEDFYRRAVVVLQPADAYFISLCKKAFPKLEMHPSIRLRDLGLNINSYIDVVTGHLSFLNDQLTSVGDRCQWDMFLMMQTASAMNVDLSDESANTKKVEKKMRERDCIFIVHGNSITVRCSYHTKILHNKGRIHFFPSHEKFPEKVLVGKFHSHLTV